MNENILNSIDSILIVSMVDALKNVFANISSTIFFEYRITMFIDMQSCAEIS